MGRLEQASIESLRELAWRRFEEVVALYFELNGRRAEMGPGARDKGIDILLDAAKTRDSMLVLNNAVNITQAFIADYNAKNP